jgi:hypothetical protein
MEFSAPVILGNSVGIGAMSAGSADILHFRPQSFTQLCELFNFLLRF